VIPDREETARPAKVGPYLLERRLGSGGMGAVWRAWDERLQRPVAVKQVRPELRDRPGVRELLRHEAAAAARLNHPSIVHIYDILEEDGADWIVMELVEGETLAQILKDGPLALPQALRLGREIAKGLAKAHSQGIVHRDLKALNVMVTPSGHAKILDFGIAKLTGAAAGEIPGALFRPGTVMGTPFAMSTEQICGTPLDHRSDLFSFGSLLYEMLTGVSPFLAETEAATLGLVVGQRQPPVRQLTPEVPPELSELVDWLLEKKARMRPQDAREVATVLNAILARQPPGGSFAESRRSGPRNTDDRPEDRTISLMPTLRRHDAASELRAADVSLGTGERRQVTVVCCGLVEIAGPETWRTPEVEDLSGIMPALRRVLYEVVTHFQGSSGTVVGPQLWIYFGYPWARDDDAKRAVLTAHELVDRVRRADWRSRGSCPLALRAGVHSGPAIVSKNRERPEPLSMGPTLDVATSIQSMASPGEVLVSENTRRLTAKSFETEGVFPGGSLPGGSTSVFRIRAPLNAFEEAFRTSAPLIAREGELDMLRQRWELVQGGESQVILISGEGGIGKSSLVHALRKGLDGLAPRWLLCYGVAHARSSPFFAVIEMLRRYWLASARSAAEELAILERLLGQYGLPVADDLPILALLLSLPLPEGAVPPPSSPDTRRRQTREVLLNLLLQATAELPVILVAEDLHWLDPSSLELIGALLEAAGGASLLVILTFRLDFELPWRHHAGWLQLHLSRLTDRDSIRLIDQIAGGEGLPVAVKQQIVLKADGVPLFLEELSKSCVEAGEAEIRSLPGLLRDSLTARLDRLGSAREVAQLAAVIGRTFSFELLASVSPLDPAALRQDLDALVRADLLHRRGSGEGATYSFKHALLQEAALELLLPGDLERLHARVAESLVDRFSAIAALQPELVAFHYAEAGNPRKAIEHWLQAGQRALQRFANLEAREHFRNGLRLIEALPPGPGRDRFEMSLQIGSAHAVIVTRGHSDAEVEALFERALALGRQLGELPLQFQSLLWSFFIWRGDLPKAWSLATQLLKTSKARHEPAGLILGLQELAALQARLGRPESALRALRRARELYPASLETGVSLFPGWDAKGHLVCEMARTLCDAGFPDQALGFARQGLQLAESRESSYGTAMALMYLTFIHLARREYVEASQHAQRMRDLCQQHGFAFFAIHGRFLVSLAGARLVAAEDAVVLIGEAIQALDALRRDHRQELHLPELLGWLAEAGVACGMTSEARWLLEEGFEIGRRTGERLGKAELFRLDGALLLAGSDGEKPSAQVRRQAEVRLRTAIDEARAVGSLWLELRAATDLGRLLCEDGHGRAAAALVSGVVDRFEEGEETADFKAAAALTGGSPFPDASQGSV
jgi:serine/threonine protein kinase/tetratricopeptide (TPR) repeat protein